MEQWPGGDGTGADPDAESRQGISGCGAGTQALDIT